MCRPIRVYQSLDEAASLQPACTADACRSGRDACPTRQACHVAEGDAFGRFSDRVVCVGLVVACLCTVVLAAFGHLPGAKEDSARAAAAVTVAAGASR